MNTDSSNSTWLTPDQAAAYLNVPVSNIYNKIHRKQIPFSKFGRLVRIKREDLERMLSEHN